jgi:hypothetical protein
MRCLPFLILAIAMGAASCSKGPPVRPTRSAPAVAIPSHSDARRLDPLAPVYAKGLEGDMRAALEILDQTNLAEFSHEERMQRDCIVRRFSEPQPASSPHSLLEALIDAYHGYWRRVLLKQLDRAAGEAYLLERLRHVLASDNPAVEPPATLDDLLKTLGATLDARGLHSIRGTTQPYHDLMVWRSEEPAAYGVELPDGPVTVNVVLLRRFESLGWSAFATCDGRYTTGWADTERLYCVADSYDLSSERFSVSYLVHEGQHFSDYRRFPKLAQPELEYRAKLAEIIESKRTTRQLVDRFASQAAATDSRVAPHAFANRAVVRGLARAFHVADAGGPVWHEMDEVRIRGAARDLFSAHTQHLVASGAETVSEVLGPSSGSN